MTPKEAWGAFSLILVLGIVIATALLYDIGVNPALVVAIGLVLLLVYFYVLYKRYNVEVVPENDIVQFDDPGDLRILCRIYGLDSSGDLEELRNRLVAFVGSMGDRTFTWVAPKAVLSFGSALEMPSVAKGALSGDQKTEGPLPGGKTRTPEHRSSISKCSVCGAPVQKNDSMCAQCGADLEFYSAVGESKVGRLMLEKKSGQARRKA